ncbi:hypothetical protein BsWGS_08084 [Bradybaena similaris]
MADAGKKKKKTKAVKDRKKKEEQEKRTLEEEQAKIKANADAKLQKIREAEERIIRAKQENEERKIRNVEMAELDEIWNKKEDALKALNSTRRLQAKWTRYMRCDGSPDPINQMQINTYINLRLEDSSHDDPVSILKDSHLDLMLIEELKYILMDTPSDELPEKDRLLCMETILKLENLIRIKLDLATLKLLCDNTPLANSETGNLQHAVTNDEIALCVWGNIVKNPRIKSVEFPEVHFTFDIPRILALSDCAVRLLVTKYDHYSSKSMASIPRIKHKEGVDTVIEQDKEENKVKNEEDHNADTQLTLKVPAESVQAILSRLRSISDEEEEEKPKQEEEPVEIVEKDYSYPPTPELTEWEDFDEEDDVIDLRAYDVLGGVYMFNLLEMPPQPKTVESCWVITKLVDPPAIRSLDYMAELSVADNNKDNKDTKKDERPPIHVNMILPEDVIFLEQPQIARWDYARNFWTTKGFSDLSFNEDARTFGFKTAEFGTFCLLQDSYINMPFQSWEMRPRKINNAVLSITAAIVEVRIEIRDAVCSLSEPQDRPELKSLRGVWVTPGELIASLKRAGINIFPTEDSSRFVSIQNKHPYAEDKIYQQMALTASSMAYAWSKWNGERGRDEIIFQAAECMDDGPLMEEEWSVFMASKRQVKKLKMTEFDEVFSEECPEEMQFKSTLYHLISSVASESAMDRIKETNFQFVECLYQLLTATRVLTYS